MINKTIRYPYGKQEIIATTHKILYTPSKARNNFIIIGYIVAILSVLTIYINQEAYSNPKSQIKTASLNDYDINKVFACRNHIILGDRAFDKDNYKLAISEYSFGLDSSYCSRYIKSATGRVKFGQSYAYLGRDDLALQQYIKVAKEYPDFPDAYYFQGVAYKNLDRNAEAYTAFAKGLEKIDKYTDTSIKFDKKAFKVDCLTNIAELYIQSNQRDYALSVYDQALKIDPNNKDIKDAIDKINNNQNFMNW